MQMQDSILKTLMIEDDRERERFMLRYIMQQRGISSRDIAQHLGVSKSYIQKVMSGHRTTEAMLDRVDSAITTISEQRGGIGEMCCEPLNLRYLKSLWLKAMA